MFLFVLPPELRREVYSVCSSRDLINLSCCSSQWYEDIKPVLWSAVRITWNHLVNENINSPLNQCMLSNLLHTKRLRFCFADEPYAQFSNARREIRDNYKVIIGHCDPDAMEGLHMQGYKCDTDGECLDLVCHHFSKLRRLSIRGDVLPTQVYSSICRLKNLTELDLHFASTNDADMTSICRYLVKLKHLDITSNRITDKALSGVSNLTSLETLRMARNCSITGNALAFLNGLVYLREVDASFCDVRHVPPLHLPSLQNLNLSSCHLRNEGLQRVSDLPTLTRLNVSTMYGFGDSSISKLGKLSSLKELYLHQTLLTNMGLRSLQYLKVKTLNIASTTITDDGLQFLKNMKSLHNLICWGNDISDVGIRTISQLSNLRELDVSMCLKVTYDGLMELGVLVFLKGIRLSRQSQITPLQKTYVELCKYFAEKKVVLDEINSVVF